MSELHADSILKSYDSRVILSDIYLGCRTGEIVGLLGRNGSGKSTLLKIIFGSLKADNRFVRVDDQVLSGVSDSHRHIKYIPQDDFLPRHIKIKRLIELFCPSGKEELIEAHPLVRQYLNRRSRELSGGERRIVEILLSIYSDSQFILIDEPFNGISPKQVEQIKALIKRESANKGFIITDHSYRNILEIADRVVLIHDGAMRQIKEPSDLVKWGYVPQFPK